MKSLVSKPKPGYALAIFDMDGTLYRFKDGNGSGIYKTRFYKEVEENGIKFIMRRLSLNVEAAEVLRNKISEEYRGDISIGLEKRYGINREEYFNNSWDICAEKYLDEDKRLRTTMQRLPCKKALLTSAPQVWAKKALKRLGIFDMFDGYWFGDGDIRKPELQAYLNVLKALNARPVETLVLDDELGCLEMAKRAGIGTVFVGSQKDRNKFDYVDYAIGEIYEIERLLRK